MTSPPSQPRFFRPISLAGLNLSGEKQASTILIKPVPYTPKVGETLFQLDSLNDHPDEAPLVTDVVTVKRAMSMVGNSSYGAQVQSCNLPGSSREGASPVEREPGHVLDVRPKEYASIVREGSAAVRVVSSDTVTSILSSNSGAEGRNGKGLVNGVLCFKSDEEDQSGEKEKGKVTGIEKEEQLCTMSPTGLNDRVSFVVGGGRNEFRDRKSARGEKELRRNGTAEWRKKLFLEKRGNSLENKHSGLRGSKGASLRHFRGRSDGSRERIFVGGNGENPWFAEHASEVEEEAGSGKDNSFGSSSHSVGSERSGTGSEKIKKKRFKRLGKIFRKEERGRGSADGTDMGSSSSSEALSMTPSSTEEGPFVQKGESRSRSRGQSVDLQNLEEDIKQAIARKENLAEVLELLIYLPEQPGHELSEMLFKYLASSNVVETGIRMLIDDNVYRFSKMKSGEVSIGYKPFREVLVHSYVTGPRRLKKAILQNNRARGELLTFLGAMHSTSLSSERFALKIHNLFAVLNGLLNEFPADFSEHLTGKRGFLSSLVRNYIHIPEVGAFICQLCAANAYAENDEDEFRYGAPNATGIVQLAKDGIGDLLVYIFGEASYPDGAVIDEKLRWQLQVMSLQCLLELSKRSLVVLRFSKTNSSYSSRFIKSANAALDQLNPFKHMPRVGLILDSGLGAVRRLDENSGMDIVVQCNNAAVCALSFATDLLDMVRSGEDSKSVVTQRTIGTIDTTGLEQLLVQKTEELCDLLDGSRAQVVQGRLRMAMVRAFRSLFGSQIGVTKRTLAEHGVAGRLITVVRKNPLCSILHGCAVECIAMSLIHEKSGKLHNAWLEALQRGGILEEMASVIEAKGRIGGYTESIRSTYDSTLVDIGFVLCMFSQDLKRAEFRDMFDSEERYELFTGSIEKGLRKVEESRRESCGGPKPKGTVVSVLANADTLAARLNDFEAV